MTDKQSDPYILIKVAIITGIFGIIGALIGAPWFRDIFFPPTPTPEISEPPISDESGTKTTPEPETNGPSQDGSQNESEVGGGTGILVFVSKRDGDNEIYSVKLVSSPGVGLSATVLEQLTHNQNFSDTFPDWSSDGTKIVFQSNRDGTYDIFLMDYLTGATDSVISTDGFESSPTWSPDGDQIYYHSDFDGDREIYYYNLASSNPHAWQLTDNDADDYSPDISPDGNKIAFFSNRDGEPRLYVYDQETRLETRMTNIWGQDPDWSPDGERIVFSSCLEEDVCDIYLISADGHGPPICLTCNDPGSDQEPAWSPDGKKIAFSSDRSGDWEIFVIDASGYNIFQVTDSPGWDGAPSWQP
jgi:Tol biopolymer transport system component